MEDQLEEDKIRKWALAWEPRTKLVAVILFIFGVISLTTIPTTVTAYLFSLLMILLMGISITLVLKRYLIILPFLLLMTIPLLFSTGLTVSNENLTFAILILLKAFTAMTVISILLDTQTMEQFMRSLAGLRVHPIIITVLMHSYRYVFLFLDDIQKMQIAAKSRLFKGGISIRNLKIFGQLIGALLIRSVDRSERVYKAMTSRSFDGRLRVRPTSTITSLDYLKTSFMLMMIFLLIFAENWVG
ncbi:cobalt ECF transporter T component CbiQ [Oceanobacillus halotolerans]|uniref:cobalt ECF transporter T component CbiQ n=1 Tax=Oceanobacillus halotolerans TaxID=2663380 RepID=UPI0013DCF106|nr:cobalt ECF transporter T component CbiQ [Oceanobacillus halotolerans]